jgi:Nitrile hydratase, alpha chain
MQGTKWRRPTESSARVGRLSLPIRIPATIECRKCPRSAQVDRICSNLAGAESGSLEPRICLREFGCEVADDVEIRVWDSSAQIRYLVLPQRPPGTERLTEEQLRSLVTPEAMIGVELVKVPTA